MSLFIKHLQIRNCVLLKNVLTLHMRVHWFRPGLVRPVLTLHHDVHATHCVTAVMEKKECTVRTRLK